MTEKPLSSRVGATADGHAFNSADGRTAYPMPRKIRQFAPRNAAAGPDLREQPSTGTGLIGAAENLLSSAPSSGFTPGNPGCGHDPAGETMLTTGRRRGRGGTSRSETWRPARGDSQNAACCARHTGGKSAPRHA